MRSEIHQLQRRLQITSIYVTHDQVEAMALSDRIVVMNNGRIEQMGAPQEIYRYPVSRFVADFIGRANFIETTVTPTGTGEVKASVLGRAVTLPIRFETNGETQVIAMFRPEALTLRDDPALPQAQVEQAMFLGSEVEYVVTVDGHHLTVIDNDPRANRLFAEGQVVGLDFIVEAVHLLPPGD
jgi:iron(III) transport system ATP-binding protein